MSFGNPVNLWGHCTTPLDPDPYFADVNSSNELLVHDAGLLALLTTIAGYVDGLEGLLTTLNTYVDGIEGSLTTIIGHIDGVEGSLTTIIGHIDGVETSLTTIIGHIDGVEGSLTTIIGHIDSLEGYLDNVETYLSSIAGDTDYIETHFNSTCVLKDSNTSTAQTATAIWTPGSGKQVVLTDFHVGVNGDTEVKLFIDSDAAGNRFFRHNMKTGMYAVHNFSKPLKCGTNKAIKLTCGAVTVDVILHGYEI